MQLSDVEKEKVIDSAKLIERLENFLSIVHNLLECSYSVAGIEVAEIMANYSDINHLDIKDTNTEAKFREITKQELFNESQSSELTYQKSLATVRNIYSFQSKFLNIYEKIKPKRTLENC